MFYTSKKIDLTPYKTLVFEGSVYSSSTNAVWVVLAAWSDIGAYFSENQKAKQSLADKSGSYKFNIDVSSLNGDYYIGFAIYHTDTEIVLRNLYLIPK